MSIPSSSATLVTLPLKTIRELKESNRELQKRNKEAVTELKVARQGREILEAKNTELENRCTKLESEKTEEGRLIQLIEEDLQSSKTTLQWSYAIIGAILSGGLVLAFPPAGAAIALGGTGSVATGAAIAGGAAGGYIVAPVVHKKTHKASIQQVHSFKVKEGTLKKA